jgi:hypothetical protein
MNSTTLTTNTPDARAQKGNGTLRYTFVDTESVWDLNLVSANRAIYPYYDHNRIGSRVITAAALFDVDILPDGTLAFGEVKSWNARSNGGSYGVVKSLFDNLAARDNRVVVTWGGVATDQQILTLSAMEHGLVLPPHFRQADFYRAQRLHLDLGLAMKGVSKTWHHLSEVADRVGVPFPLLRDKAKPIIPRNYADWLRLVAHCELDTLITAIVMIAWRIAQGTPSLRFEPAVVAMIAAFLRQRPSHPMAAYLTAFSDELTAIIGEGQMAA